MVTRHVAECYSTGLFLNPQNAGLLCQHVSTIIWPYSQDFHYSLSTDLCIESTNFFSGQFSLFCKVL